MNCDQERRWAGAAFVAVLLLALGARCGAALWWQSRLPEGRTFGLPDSESYWFLAGTIARGEPYQFGGPDAKVFRAPGYPVVLAPLFLIFGDQPPVLAARFQGAVLGTLAVGLIGWLARQLAPRFVIPAMTLAAVYPGAIMMSVLVLSEAAFCPVMVLQLVCWAKMIQPQASPRRAGVWAAAAGAAAAAAVLIRPSWLLFTPVAGMAMLLASGRRWRRLQQLAVMAAAFVVCMAPWWIRNYRVVHAWTPTTLQVGASLYDGLSPEATGASDMRFVPRFREALQQRDQQASEPPEEPFEVRLDRSMRDASIAWAKAHPSEVVRLMGVKFVRVWNPFPNDRQFGSAAARWITLVGFFPLLALSMMGLIRWRRSSLAWLCAAPAFYFTALHLIFVASIRYRQPAMLAATVLAAAALQPLLARRRGRLREWWAAD